jgi:rhodanese-related sulfurtransferase
MPAWKKGKNPVVSTIANLKMMLDKGMTAVVVDVRPHMSANKGHIPGAVSIAMNKMENSKHLFPADKVAPIILYADDTDTAVKAFSAVRNWGYKNTSALEGGIKAWKNAGNTVGSGKLADKIVYVPKPVPGEIRVEEFKSIAEQLPADKYVLDVRDEDEAMQGMLKGAHNIASQQILYRLDEIPQNKEIIIHCMTGVRAEMVYYTLKEKGYKARFLNANIAIDPDGKYEINKE